MTDDKKVVWILGAGFSQSLGAPLTSELFSEKFLKRTQATLPENFCTFNTLTQFADLSGTKDLEALATGKYQTHANKKKYTDQFPIWGTNVEEFLEFFDRAASNDPQAQTYFGTFDNSLKGLTKEEWKTESLKARISIATVLIAFMRHFKRGDLSQHSDSERWQPYFRWSEKANCNDTIITFNYDLVSEIAFSKPKPNHPLIVARPGNNTPAQPTLFKLHGSLDWTDRSTTDEWTDISTFISEIHKALSKNEDFSYIMGIPGPSKTNGAIFAKHLKPIWDTACERISKADALVFVGYRFPETDAYAKERLLKAIQNIGEKAVVRIVLGPDKNHQDIVRLRAMLAWALKLKTQAEIDKRIVIEPMWAEDFLAVFERDDLF